MAHSLVSPAIARLLPRAPLLAARRKGGQGEVGRLPYASLDGLQEGRCRSSSSLSICRSSSWSSGSETRPPLSPVRYRYISLDIARSILEAPAAKGHWGVVGSPERREPTAKHGALMSRAGLRWPVSGASARRCPTRLMPVSLRAPVRSSSSSSSSSPLSRSPTRCESICRARAAAVATLRCIRPAMPRARHVRHCPSHSERPRGRRRRRRSPSSPCCEYLRVDMSRLGLRWPLCGASAPRAITRAMSVPLLDPSSKLQRPRATGAPWGVPRGVSPPQNTAPLCRARGCGGQFLVHPPDAPQARLTPSARAVVVVVVVVVVAVVAVADTM